MQVSVAAGFDIVHDMIWLYLSILGMPSLFPHRNLQQTATKNESIRASLQQSIIILIVKGKCKQMDLHLMYPECISNALDYQLLFFGPPANSLKFWRYSLQELHR